MRDAGASETSPSLDFILIQLAERYSISRRFEAGEVIFEEGEPGNSMLMTLTGSLKIVKQNPTDGTHVHIASRGAGEFLGEMALVEESPRSATVIAETNCEVLEFSRDNFEKIIREQPELATRVLQSLSNKLRESDSHRITELEESNRLLNASNQELVRLNAFLDCVIDRSPSPVLLTTRAGHIFRMNTAASKMFGVDGSSSTVVVDDLFVEFKLSEFINLSTDSWHGEVTARRGEECFPAYLSVASLTGHNDSVLNLMTCQDITELQAFNTTIRELEKYSSAQEAAVELAHDLKNMLAVLLGNVDLVLSRLSEDQRSKSERAIEAIAEAARETSQYVENVMAFREERGEFLPVNLVTIARAVTRFCRLQGRFRHIKLDCSVSEDFPRLLHVREGQIQSVILNLLINAAEALSESEDTSSRAIDLGLSADESENRVVITVSDNGPGIDSTYLPKVFSEQFTTKERGHGIGLVSVARIVRSHGGDVSVDTHPGQGAKFTVTLPIMREPGDA